jgi:hypothetical protein
MKRCVSENRLLPRIEQESESKRKEMIKAGLLLPYSLAIASGKINTLFV